MCGRFNSHVDELQGWSDSINKWPDIQQSFNVSPTSTIAAFRSDLGEPMRWGLIPSWAESFESSYATFNARIVDFFLEPCVSILTKIFLSSCTVSTMNGPLFSMTHSACAPKEASDTSALVAIPFFAKFSRT